MNDTTWTGTETENRVRDGGKQAARYVTETASEHPVSTLLGTLGTAALGFLAGYFSTGHSPGGWDDWQKQQRDDWQRQRREWEAQLNDWQKLGADLRDRVRAGAPGVSEAATNAGANIYRNVRDKPVLGLMSAVAIGCILGYSLRSRG